MRKKQGLKGAIFYNHFLLKTVHLLLHACHCMLYFSFGEMNFCQEKMLCQPQQVMCVGNKVPRFKDSKGVVQMEEHWTLTERDWVQIALN